MTPAVRAENISFRFKKKVALEQLTLALYPGELTGLIGPDGVGKSTLLSLISGARKMQDGSLYVLGGDMRSKSHRRQCCPAFTLDDLSRIRIANYLAT